MDVTTLVIAWVLLGQQPATSDPFGLNREPPVVRPPATIEDQAPVQPPAVQPPGTQSTTTALPGAKPAATIDPAMRPASGLASVPSRPAKGSAIELLADVLRMSPDGSVQPALKGRPWVLLEVMSKVTDRGQQIRAAQAYWKLSAAVAEYRYSWDQYRRLVAIEFPEEPVGGPDAPDAQLPEGTAELASAKAEFREAQLSMTKAQYELAELLQLQQGDPLPLPGDLPYVGNYRTYFETLYSARPASLEIRLVDRTLPLRRQAIDVRATAVRAAQDALDATYEQFRGANADLTQVQSAWQEVGRQRRALIAAVRDYNHDIAYYALNSAPRNLTTATLVSMLVAPQRPVGTGVIRAGGTDAESGSVNPASLNQPVGDDRFREFGPTSANDPAWKELEDAASKVREARKATLDGSGHSLYAGLVKLNDPAERAGQLTDTLHWDRALPEDPATAITLAECLASVPGADRRVAIGAFWQAREQAARYHALQQQAELLTALFAAVLSNRQQPGGPEAMLRLREARLGTQADLLEAEAGLLAARGKLTEACRRALTSHWLMPNTAPHAKGYRLAVDKQGNLVADTSVLQRLVNVLPQRIAAIESRAAAVVNIDAARAADLQQYEETGRGFDTVLADILRQEHETTEFLSALTRYNLDIADYALASLPGDVPSDKLVSTLVLARTTR